MALLSFLSHLPHNVLCSEEEEKGSDCIPQFRTMQECFEKYPEVYGKYADDDDSEKLTEQEEDKESRQEGGEGKTAAEEDGGHQQTESESKSEGEQTATTAVVGAI